MQWDAQVRDDGNEAVSETDKDQVSRKTGLIHVIIFDMIY
jgi:hypothetical protein